MIPERRKGGFIERLSIIVIIGSFIGAFFVLTDPTGTMFGMKFGGGGFSPDLKGAVINSMMLGGFAAILGFWFGGSKNSGDKNE